MKHNDYRRAAALLRRARRIALAIHAFPDGDAIGSAIALALCLKKRGKKVSFFCPTRLPSRYSFLPFFKEFRQAPKRGEAFDAAVAVDCATRVQLGSLYPVLFLRTAQTLEIDHHSSRKSFARFSLIDPRAAAVGEIIYRLNFFLRAPLTKDLATALLVSIIVETGSFRLPTVREETFSICARLVAAGVDYYGVVERAYWSRTRAEIGILGLCFSRLKFLRGGLAVTRVRLADMRKFGACEDDVDPVADQIRTLRDVRVVLLLREIRGGRWRVSLRSKGAVDVGRIAEAFGGGGHPDVSGCFLPKTRAVEKRLTRYILKTMRS